MSLERMNQRLEQGEVIIIDGGMGSEIEARGVPMDDNAWCAVANLEHADVVQAIHEDFIRAGADVIIANTFAAGRPTLESAGKGDKWEEANRAAMAAALAARDAAGPETVVAGAVGGMPTATDITFHERGLDPDELRDAFAAQSKLLAESGADVIALEMVGPGTYARPAIEGAVASGIPVWLGLSVLHLLDDGETDYGDLADPVDRAALEEILEIGAEFDLAAVTVMHSNLEQTVPAIDLVRTHWDGLIAAYPHVGKFNQPHWEFVDIAPEDFLTAARDWVEHGATMVGGCCGIGPAQIAGLSEGFSKASA